MGRLRALGPRGVAAAVTGLLVLAVLVRPALAEVPPPTPADAGCGDVRSWIGGSVDLCAGTLVYRDYVFDDYGGGTHNPFDTSTGGLSPTQGDQRYTTDVNSADLVSLRLTINGSNLVARFELNALYHPGSTVAALAIDTDNNSATGGGAWPGLGVTSSGWEVLKEFDSTNATVDTLTNTITGTMPVPAGTTWRVQAVTAVKGGPVMNVAFRGVDEGANWNPSVDAPNTTGGVWWEDHQATALHAGDISGFGYQVSVADMRNHVTRRQVVGPGMHERVYTSAYTLPPGEGMSYTGTPGRGTGGSAGGGFAQVFNFYGRYQPYGVYIPHHPGPFGMQMVFHGSNANQASLINEPGMQQRVGEDLHRILVVPLARGPNGYGSDISERDRLDVMDDAEASYPVDREQVFAGGYSQGGYITFRMAMLYPDRFAGFISWVGFTGDDTNGTPANGPITLTAGAVGNMLDFVGNLRHVPGAMMYSGADELVQIPSSAAMDQAFKAQESAYTWYLHPGAEHLTYAVLDDWRKEAAYTRGLRLVHDPARITFRTAAELDDPAEGIVHDRAYWISRIRGRGPGYEDTDITSFGCGRSVPTYTTGQGAGSDPVPWVSDFRRQVGTTALPAANRFTAVLANVASLTIDDAGACLTPTAVPYHVVTDGAVSLRLSDGRSLALPAAGTYDGVLAAATGPGSAGRDAGLPGTSTGLPTPAAPVLLTLSGVLLLRRWRRAPRRGVRRQERCR